MCGHETPQYVLCLATKSVEQHNQHSAQLTLSNNALAQEIRQSSLRFTLQVKVIDCCLPLSQTIGHLGSVQLIMTGSSSPGIQQDLFPAVLSGDFLDL